jgi:mono/diheme cytochrome c family protein
MATERLSKVLIIISSITFLALSACSEQTPEIAKITANYDSDRWYTEQQVTQGKAVYEVNCIGCHNANAGGTFQWKQKLEDGSYPPPPLNGSAHAWHHPLPVLLRTINEGGIAMGGKMPPFKDVLSDDEKHAVIAYFQSFWSDDIYGRWKQRGQAR